MSGEESDERWATGRAWIMTVVGKLNDLMRRIDPIYMSQKRRLVANIKEIRGKAAL
jgi:hypothetical protein